MTKEALAIHNMKIEKEEDGPKKSVPEQGYQILQRVLKKRPCPICGEESLYLNNPQTLAWIICRKCKYEQYVFVPYYWLLFILAFLLLFPLVIVLGFFGIAISLAIVIYAMLDYQFVFTYKMNNSLDKAILRKLEKQDLVSGEPIIIGLKGRM